MAHVTAGITASWGTTALGEITEIRWRHGGGLPQSRGVTVSTAATATAAAPWSFDMGTIEISHLSATAVGAVAQWGRKATLAIGGTARDSVSTSTIVTVNLTTKAICQTLDISAIVNDVWRYKSTFKIVRE